MSDTIYVDITIAITKVGDKFKTTVRGFDNFERTFSMLADNMDEALQNGAFIINKETEKLIDLSANIHARQHDVEEAYQLALTAGRNAERTR